jgi:DNA-binding MarR family transcriptional regulator
MELAILEKYIKMNSHFVNEYYKGVVGVIVVNNIIFQDLEKFLSQYKLTYQQFNILRILKGQYPKAVPLNLLKDRMLHKQSDVSRLVDRLVNMKFVEKKIDDTNKRKLCVGLSELGYEVINSIDVNGDGFKSITQNLSEDDMILFNQLIGKMISLKVD